MKKNRYLLFGYHIQNGALCIHEAEAAVVRQVFADYQAGMSYRRIAESLTAKGIPYMENRTGWNKHMVKRMLENSRYCGRDDFPPILPADTFGAVAALIGQKSHGEPLPRNWAASAVRRFVGLVEPSTKGTAETKNMKRGAAPPRGASRRSASPTKPCWTA